MICQDARNEGLTYDEAIVHQVSKKQGRAAVIKCFSYKVTFKYCTD